MVDDSDSVCKQGLLKKVKTNKLKYFVLHNESTSKPARLEYYAKKANWDRRKAPGRTIYLKTCFSINSFSDSKTRYGMMLYFKDDSFQIGFEDAETRDSWLMAVRSLNNANPDAARPMFPHVWDVKIKDKDLGKSFEGEFYRLCLNDRQVILVKRSSLDPSVIFPLEVVRRCGHTSCFFNIEVGRQASTGSGQIWMEVEDSLIAENVHHAVLASMNKSKDDEFDTIPQDSISRVPAGNHSAQPLVPSIRGRSPSLDSTRTTGSDDIPDHLHSHRALTPDPGRISDNISLSGGGSQSGISDASADDSYTPMLPSSRLTLPSHDSPHHKSDSHIPSDPYLVMSPGSQHSRSDYMDMHPSLHPVADTKGYVDMTANHHHDHGSPYLEMNPQENNNKSSTPYMEMSVKRSNNPYIDMTSGPNMRERGGETRRPDHVKSYLADSKMPQRHYSVGSRPHKGKKKVDTSSYVEMHRNPQLSEKEKSCSAPHLMPLSLASNPDLSHLVENVPMPPQNKQDTFMMMEFDRPRTGSETHGHRPRGATWSQTTRPRSSSHGQKHRPTKINKGSSRDSVKSTCSDYMDMASKTNAYVEMNPHKESSRTRKGSHPNVPHLKISPPKMKSHRQQKSNSFDYMDMHNKAISPGDYVDVSLYGEENKENAGILMPRRQSQSHSVCEPFPELSGSSEEDISMHSNDSSTSSRMSASSSHSSLHRGDDSRRYNPAGYGASVIDSDVYVDCQPTTMHSRTSSLSSQSYHSHHSAKPTRVASFISDDTVPSKSASPPLVRSQSPLAMPTAHKHSHSSYMDMPKSHSNAEHRDIPHRATAADYMDMPSPKSSMNAYMEMPAKKPTEDAYMQMPAQKSQADPYRQTHSKKPDTDSYMEMQPAQPRQPVLDMSMYKPLPKITRSPSPAHSESTQSQTSTLATSVTDSKKSSKGSSEDSNTTVVDDPYSMMDFHQESQVSPPLPKPQQTHSVKCPKAGISYIRQTSNDVILPTPMRPAHCYIRNASVSSMTGEDLGQSSANAAAVADNAALMDFLMAQSEHDHPELNLTGFRSTSPNPRENENLSGAISPYMMMDTSTTAPVSPIQLKSLGGELTVDLPSLKSPRSEVTKSISKSASDGARQHPKSISEESESDIPGSAAELQHQQEQQSILEKLSEEVEETTPSALAPLNVPCFIKEDKKPKRQTSSSSKASVSESNQPPPEKATSYIIQEEGAPGDSVFPESPQKHEKTRKPAPALPPRKEPGEKAQKRLSLTKEKEPEEKEATELIYVKLDLEGANAGPVSSGPISPKPRATPGEIEEADPEQPIVYAKIDHKQTEHMKKSRKPDKK